MATEILLMKDVEGLGAEGDVVKVHDGYARNFLLPRGMGAPVSDGMRRKLEKSRRVRDAERKQKLEAAQNMANVLRTISCTIPVKVGENEKLFGSVGNGDIAASLKAQSIEIDRHLIVLDEPIRELGVYDVPVKLHPDVEAAVKVWVVEE
jgi:large subunit ribosomal protein L9